MAALFTRCGAIQPQTLLTIDLNDIYFLGNKQYLITILHVSLAMRSEITLNEKNMSFGMNSIPVPLVIVASLSLVKTFYNRIVEPSSFFSSTFCLTYLHVAYNKQKMDLLYPISKNKVKKSKEFYSKGS